MATVTVNKTTYTVEPLYQWDLNQQLEVYGLSLATVPEVHFTNAAMDKAIVRQATMDAAGVIRAEVPNSMLQKPYTILAYICTYAGSTFETQYKLEIPVKGRAKPNDYTLVDDPEVYSFNALENQVANALRLMDAEAGVAATKYAEAVSAQEAASATYASAEQLLRDTTATIDDKVDTAVEKSVGAITPDDIGAEKANTNLVELVNNHLKTLGGADLMDLGVASKIVAGSYVGTDKSGTEGTVTLSFDFAPKVLMVFSATGTQFPGNGMYYAMDSNTSRLTNITAIGYPPALTTEFAQGLFVSESGSYYGRSLLAKRSADGKTISWYHPYGYYNEEEDYTYYTYGEYALNGAATYHYVAIG